jgi:AcrR family transcriptional regulator
MHPRTRRAARKTPRAATRKSAAPPAGRQRLELEERRAQLLSLGLEAFSSRPYDEVSLDDVARTANVSKGLILHYFSSKRDFYVAVIRDAARLLVASTLARALPTEGTPFDRLREGIDAYLEFVEERADAYVALMRGGIGSDPGIVRVVDETRRLFLDRIIGEVPFSHPRLRIYVVGFIGFVEATSIDWLEHRTLSREQLRELMVDACRAMIARLLEAPPRT